MVQLQERTAPKIVVNEQKKIIIAIEKNFAYLTSIAENLE